MGIILFVIFVSFDTYTIFTNEQQFVQNTTTIVKESIENQYINDIRILMLLNYGLLDDYIETKNPDDLLLYMTIK
ncbi:MAG: hypothetical protein HOK63_04225 [Thaumarchaeota archaeon]|nr:hypothetical protein [Nitrososphaerota archaeon]